MSTQQLLLTSPLQTLPTPSLDGALAGVPTRGTKYGEQFIRQQDLRSLAADGTLFSTTNPTLATAITSHILGAWDATKPSFLIENGDTSGRKQIVLDSLQFNYVVVPASGTNAFWALILDTGSATRYSSGGTTGAPVNATLYNTPTTISRVYFGAVTAAAATSSVRRIGQGQFSSVIMVTGDTVKFNFGAASPSSGGGYAGTTARALVVDCPPVVLNQNDKALFYMWYASNAATAATWELTALHSER